MGIYSPQIRTSHLGISPRRHDFSKLVVRGFSRYSNQLHPVVIDYDEQKTRFWVKIRTL